MSNTRIMEIKFVMHNKNITLHFVPSWNADDYFLTVPFDHFKKTLEYYFVEKLKQNIVPLKICYTDVIKNPHCIFDQQGYEEYLKNRNNKLKLSVYAQITSIFKEMPEFDSTELVLHNIICSNCKITPIIGFRYKCVQCANYDLCGKCESQHIHSDHIMLRLLKVIYPCQSDSGIIIHDGVSCNRCYTNPIIGYCYKCVECPNYNLCEDCETKKKHTKHTMMRSSYYDDNKKIKDLVNDVPCGICKSEPIVGYLFKCLDCDNFYLCKECVIKKKHFDHNLAQLVYKSAAQYDKVRHAHVRCECCRTRAIEGFRYMCVQCKYFNLCEKCQSQHNHADHMMLRVPRTRYEYHMSLEFLQSLMTRSAEETNHSPPALNPATVPQLDLKQKASVSSQKQTASVPNQEQTASVPSQEQTASVPSQKLQRKITINVEIIEQ